MVEHCQLDQYGGRNVPLAQFIVAVCLLGAVEMRRDLGLREVGIFPKVFDALIHGDHLIKSIVYLKMLYLHLQQNAVTLL